MLKHQNIADELRSLDFKTPNISFFCSFLRVYDFPESTIKKAMLVTNESVSSDFFIKDKISFFNFHKINLAYEFEKLKQNKVVNKKNRFILLANKNHIYAHDTKTSDSVNCSKSEIYKYFEFFLPLMGVEIVNSKASDSINIKTSEKIAELYNKLIFLNSIKEIEKINLLIVRLLLIFYADSSGIFGNRAFNNLLVNFTNENGGNTQSILQTLFERLEGSIEFDSSSPYLKFPIMGISLFDTSIDVPMFDRACRKLLVEISSMDWNSVNPDILGSLIQSIVNPSDEEGLCNHYSSVPNILKLIGPLFLDDLYEELENNRDNQKGLKSLLSKISQIRILDPSCGAGNFLIISLQELLKIEKEALELLNSPDSGKIGLAQFYGIEHSYLKSMIAKVGLWITLCQSNTFNKMKFNYLDSTNILCANPTRVDWSNFFSMESEAYIVSSPTFKGARKQSPQQKKDIAYVFNGASNIKNLDYCSCWLYKAAQLINNTNVKAAFVLTNSLTQGEQVGLLWPKIFSLNVMPFFTHTSFKWRNKAKGSTGVTVVIIGICKNSIKTIKTIYTPTSYYNVDNISPYLISGQSIIVKKSRAPISCLPKMPKGNMPYDGGNLLLSREDKINLESHFPESKKYLKKILGSNELIKGIERWCLWINNCDVEEASLIPPIRDRIAKVSEARSSSTDAAAQKLAERAHQFREITTTTDTSIIIPSVSSEKRKYIPIDFIGSNQIVSNLAFVIYDTEAWVFGVITSYMHILWIRTVCGALETRLRYSSQLGYNTFPFPNIDEKKKQQILKAVFDIIEVRELTPEKTLSQLYDKELMSEALVDAHHVLDSIIESCYRTKPFISDQERLEFLFTAYSQQLEVKNG